MKPSPLRLCLFLQSWRKVHLLCRTSCAQPRKKADKCRRANIRKPTFCQSKDSKINTLILEEKKRQRKETSNFIVMYCQQLPVVNTAEQLSDDLMGLKLTILSETRTELVSAADKAPRCKPHSLHNIHH
jgi:hypothetical protein